MGCVTQSYFVDMRRNAQQLVRVLYENHQYRPAQRQGEETVLPNLRNWAILAIEPRCES